MTKQQADSVIQGLLKDGYMDAGYGTYKNETKEYIHCEDSLTGDNYFVVRTRNHAWED